MSVFPAGWREGLPEARFDRVARIYRWAEYLALGPLLRNTREHFLATCSGARNALILGDGDGRFTAALLRQIPDLRVVAVDTSPKMLALLSQRCARQGDSHRVRTVHGSALHHYAAPDTDLIASHFFLDCLTQGEVNALAGRLSKEVSVACRWVISEFGVPASGIGRLLAKGYVRALYVAFRMLTGLRPQHLPNHQTALQEAGFVCLQQHRRVGGLLVSQLWQLRTPSPASTAGTT